jgi:hypothetical protein
MSVSAPECVTAPNLTPKNILKGLKILKDLKKNILIYILKVTQSFIWMLFLGLPLFSGMFMVLSILSSIVL